MENEKEKVAERGIVKERKRKGYLHNLFIFDHLSLHFVAFVTLLM